MGGEELGGGGRERSRQWERIEEWVRESGEEVMCPEEEWSEGGE